MARPAFCRGALLSLLLTAICAADEDLVRRAADAVHRAFVAQRWADHESAFEEFHRVSMEHGAAPLSADTLRLSKVVRLEHLICIARERLEPALSNEHEEFGASVRALVDARQQLGAIADLDPATSRLLRASIAGITTVIADATEARLRRELHEVDAALTEKRWDDCGPILERLRPRPKQLELDVERVHRAEGFAQQIFALTRIVQAERDLELARSEAYPRGRLASARRALEEAIHPRADDLRRRLAEFGGELDSRALREQLERLEDLVAGLPPNGDSRFSAVQRDFWGVERSIGQTPESAHKSKLTARSTRLRVQLEEWRKTFASLEGALTGWAQIKEDPRFGNDHGATAESAHRWLSSTTTADALALHASNPRLMTALEEATSVRDESGRRWAEEMGRRLDTPNGVVEVYGEIQSALGLPGQPELLTRARALMQRREGEREQRHQDELAQRRAGPARLRSLAWALYGTGFVACALLIGLRKSPPSDVVEGDPPSVLAALGRTLLAVAVCIGVGQLLVGYVFFLFSPPSQTDLSLWFLRHMSVMTWLFMLVCAGVSYAYWLVGWGPEIPPRPDHLRLLQWFVISALLALGSSAGLSWGQEQLGFPADEQWILVRAMANPTFSLYIALVFIGPLGEELLFRRLVYGQLRRPLGRGPAILLSSAAFAAIHLNPTGFFVYMAIGIALCVAYEKSGRLAVPIAVHALFNLISISLQSPA